MSTRYNSGSHYENHQRSEELHDVAAHAHRSAEEQRGKQDHLTGGEHSRQALEYSEDAHTRTSDAHQSPMNEHGVATFGHNEIAARAYEIWRERGCTEGSSEEDWFRAAKELRLQTP
jgi:hypothetical protein